MSNTQKIAIVALVAFLAFSPSVFAAATSNVVTASASIASALTLETTIIQHEGGVDTEVGSMNFGSLTPTGFGGLASTRFFTVYVSAQTQSLPYIITQNGEDMHFGSITMPDNAQNMVLVYNAADNGSQTIPTGAFLGTPVNDTWVGNRQIYDSENTNAQPRAIQCIYGLRGDAALPAGSFVPATQAAGNYTANITYTVTV